MADLNSTIVRGKLRVTETLNTTGNINTAGNLYATTVYSNGTALSDTKNTAGSTNSNAQLYLIGAGAQQANPQTYSNSKLYATNGALHASSIEASTYNLDGHIGGTAYISTGTGKINLVTIATGGSLVGGALTVSIPTPSDTSRSYTINFPTESGTVALKKYKHNISLYGGLSGGPNASASCTFSFISNSATAISSLSDLNSALASYFTNKVCPACGQLGYTYLSAVYLALITGVSYSSSMSGITVQYLSIASTSGDTMTISAAPSSGASMWSYAFTSATIADTVEVC